MTQPAAYVIPKLSDVYTNTEQMQNCFKNFFAKCAPIIFSIMPNPNNCELHTMARRFNFIRKDRSFVSKVQ